MKAPRRYKTKITKIRHDAEDIAYDKGLNAVFFSVSDLNGVDLVSLIKAFNVDLSKICLEAITVPALDYGVRPGDKDGQILVMVRLS